MRIHELSLRELLDAAEIATRAAVLASEIEPLLADILFDWSEMALREALVLAIGNRAEGERRARVARRGGN